MRVERVEIVYVAKMDIWFLEGVMYTVFGLGAVLFSVFFFPHQVVG